MSETAIRVDNIGKLYRLGIAERHDTLRDSIVHTLGTPGRMWKRISRRKPAANPEEWLWALRNICFEVKRGELVGVIGRNGAGKSTLLKVLSRITAPTEGQADITGRVGSLLEVGTGFHPELSGRENIFLNGAILGMRKAEIARKFDEIVAFSELEKFVDTPVKHYSSGMYMRLAFAVAAHLEPEILIVDEVLAVGDAGFQKKCLGKMGEVSRTGRTVLFVTHNIAFVEAICKRAILLDKGQVVAAGPAPEIVSRYNNAFGDRNEIYRVCTGELLFEGVQNRHELDGVNSAQDISFHLGLHAGAHELRNVYIDFALVNEHDEVVVHSRSKFLDRCFAFQPKSSNTLVYTVCAPMLAPGQYYLTLYAFCGRELLWVEHVDACVVSAKAHFGNSQLFDGVRSAIIPRFELELTP